jgi:hypothetical protein
MKSLNENLFENLPLIELEERLEMSAVELEMLIAAEGSHSCSSLDCVQHSNVPTTTT